MRKAIVIATSIPTDCIPEILPYPETIEKMVAAGKLGFRSAEGFYRYAPAEKDAIRLRRDTALLEEAKLFRRLVSEGQIRISDK